jgi:DNA-binding NtrC family response regulator
MINELNRWMRWWEERAAPPLISEERWTDAAAFAAKRQYLDRPPPVCFVVDDDEAHRHFLSLVLQDEGVETGLFADAAAMREGLARRSPDLIFLNVRPLAENATEAIHVLAESGYQGPLQLMSASSASDVDAISKLGRRHDIDVLSTVKRPMERNAILRVLRSQKLDVAIS